MLLAALFVLGGCGLKGDLYLPEPEAPDVDSPAPSSGDEERDDEADS